MALSTRKKNIIIADWRTGAFSNYSQLANKYKINSKTAKKIILSINHIESNRKKQKAKDKRGYVYFIRAGNTNNYKIGITSNNLENRISSIQGGNHLILEIVDYVHCSNINTKEKKLHDLFRNQRSHREWFIFDDISDVIVQFDNYRKLTVLEQSY